MGDSSVLISCTICPHHIFQTYFGQVGFHHEPVSKTKYSEAPVLCCSDMSVSGETERLFRCEEFSVQICVCVFQVKRSFIVKSLLFRSVCVFQVKRCFNVKNLLFRSLWVFQVKDHFDVKTVGVASFAGSH